MWPFDEIDRLERAEALDRAAAPVRRTVQRLLSGRRPVQDALHGVWLGHPLHPVLVQATLGSLLSASLVDLVGGKRSVSSGLIATGLVLTPPTVAAGAADWSASNPDQQRVGLVHAATNGVAVACYAAALAQRARGRSGRVLSLLGAAVSTAGATLGGHLAYHQGLGANHTDRVRDLAPQDWRPLGSLADLPDGTPVRRDAGDVPVFVLRRGGEVTVLADRCPHLDGPLSEGELAGTDGDVRIVCPWHGSEFRLDDGCVVHGPATAAVPRFATRVVDGAVQARIVESAGAPTL
ncbi:MAG TPA: Rieske (2Fe-2S) protein [Pseudonocardia sp.]|nr:Rieske (2Fe-2S) protein [Pseudonocardia sp.]